MEGKGPYAIFNFIDIELRNTQGYQTFYGNYFQYGIGIRSVVKARVSGITQGNGAKVRIFGTGWAYKGSQSQGIFTFHYWDWSTGIGSVVPLNYGAGYSIDDDIVIRIQGLRKVVYDDEVSSTAAALQEENALGNVRPVPTDSPPRYRIIRPAPVGNAAGI